MIVCHLLERYSSSFNCRVTLYCLFPTYSHSMRYFPCCILAYGNVKVRVSFWDTAVLTGTTYQVLRFPPTLLLSFDWRINWKRRFDIPSGMTQQTCDRSENRNPNPEEKPVAKHCPFTLFLCLKAISPLLSSPQLWSTELLTLNATSGHPAAVLHTAPNWNHPHQAIMWYSNKDLENAIRKWGHFHLCGDICN